MQNNFMQLQIYHNYKWEGNKFPSEYKIRTMARKFSAIYKMLKNSQQW